MTYLERKHSDAIADNTLNISSYFDPRFMIDYIDKDDVDDLRDRVLSIWYCQFEIKWYIASTRNHCIKPEEFFSPFYTAGLELATLDLHPRTLTTNSPGTKPCCWKIFLT